jgi:hypothetical protein
MMMMRVKIRLYIIFTLTPPTFIISKKRALVADFVMNIFTIEIILCFKRLCVTQGYVVALFNFHRVNSK